MSGEQGRRRRVAGNGPEQIRVFDPRAEQGDSPMKPKAILGLALGGLLSVAPVSASAAELLVVYQGTVANGTDGLGLFGAAGSSLAGQAYTVFFDYDVGVAGAKSVNTADRDFIYGGSLYDAASPLVSVTFTIAGITQVMKGDTSSDVGIFRDLSNYLETAAFDTPFTQVGDKTVSYFDTVFGTYLSHPVGLSNDSLIEPNSQGGITVAGDPTAYAGFFDFYAIGGTSTAGQFASGASITAAYLKDSVAAPIAPLAASVPEPASWLMMIAGFGAVGMMMRRKTRVRVAYAAI
jgi:hypothetical protein